MSRAMLAGLVASFGGAAVLAILAVAAFVGGSPGLGGWGMLLGAGLLIAAGVAMQSAGREQAEALGAGRSHIELLEAQIDQQRSSIDRLADGLDIALFICDSKATILYANRRAMELFRFEDPVGRTLLAVTLSYDLEQLVLQAARMLVPQHAELNFAYPMERTGLAKAWPEEEAGRVFLSVYDITDLRRLERVRRDFVSNVSHELRTPLTIIRSMAETLLDEPESPAAKGGKYLQKVISEVDRLTAMANDLLVLTAAESSPVEKRPTDVAEIFRSVVDQLKGSASEKGLEITYKGPWSLVAPANEQQIRQVALNLIENAINYTNEGRVIVVVRQEGDEVVASVNDSGIGIGSEHVPRIFERFYRVDKGRARATGGTGLGLSIVRHIVEAHGGSVQVESALKEGSTFTIRFPNPEPSMREMKAD